jgi:hypothetical protein
MAQGRNHGGIDTAGQRVDGEAFADDPADLLYLLINETFRI